MSASARIAWTASDGHVRIVEVTTERPYSRDTDTAHVMERTNGKDALGAMRWVAIGDHGDSSIQIRTRDLVELLEAAGLVTVNHAPSLSCQSCQIGEHGACKGPTCHCGC